VIYQYRQWPDGRGCFPYASEGIRTVYEVTPAGVRESAAGVFGRIHPDDAAAVVATISRSVETLQEWRCEYRVRLPARGVRWLAGHSMPERLPDGSTLWHGYISDVTDRKAAEDSVRESEERFRALFDAAPYANTLTDEAGRYVAVNRAFLAASGLTQEEVVGKTPVELGFVPAPAHEAARARLAADGRLDNVEMATAGPGGGRAYLLSARRVRIGGRFQDITSTVDVTDWKRAEAALRESEERFRAFMRISPVLAWVVSADGVHLYANVNYARFLRRTPDQVVGRTLCDLFGPEYAAEYAAVNARVLGGGVAVETTERAVRPDGSEGHFLAYKFPIPRPGGTPDVGGIAIDITERVRAVEAAREAERFAQHVADILPDVVYVWDLAEQRTVYLNRAGGVILGYAPDDLPRVTDGRLGVMHPDDQARFPAHLADVLALADGAAAEFEYRMRHADGSWRWFRSRDTVFQRGPDGSARQVIGAAADVTARRAAEEALRESEGRFRTLIDDLDVGVVLLSPTDGITLSNPAAAAILGLTPDQLRGVEARDPRWEIVREDGTPFGPDEIPFSVVVRTRQPLRNVVVGARNQRTGARTWMQVNGTPRLGPDGSLLHVILTFVDISDRRRAEEALRESEALLRQTFEHSAIGMALVGTDKRYQRVNPALCALFGYSEAELLGLDCVCTTAPEDRESDLEWVDALVTGRRDSYSVEKRYLRADGTRVWAQLTVSLIRDPAGRPKYFVSLIQDVGARLAAEAAVREAEYRQRLALDAGRMGTWDWDVRNGTVAWDARQQELFGFAPGEYDGRPDTFFTRVHPDDAPAVRRQLGHALAAGADYVAEFRVFPRPGEVRWFAGRGRVLRDAAGRPARMIGINYDRTEQMQTLIALEEAGRRYRLALDSGRMGTWDWEIGTDRLDWDDRQVALFGLPPGGFDGRLTSFRGYVHPDDRAAVDRVLAAAANGTDFDGEFRIVHPSGEVRWVRGSGAVLPADRDRPARLVGINYDMTERVLAEERLRDSVREKEAMLKEIHHRVKNNLQVISSLLNLQAERIPDPAARAVFLESQSRVRAMALVHETLYGSESLARIELPRYIDRVCDSLLQTFGGNERVAVERDVAPVGLDLDRALPVGLIVSELVSNALKYAFPGGRPGRIRVALAAGDAGLELSVADDGVGLPAGLDLDRAASLGLYLVRVLTRQLRGTLAVGPAGGGASFTIRFPT
jgi:PAS domain S-box-containing protein